MIQVFIVRGLDLGPEDSELYITLSLEGSTKTSQLVAKDKSPLEQSSLAPPSGTSPTNQVGTETPSPSHKESSESQQTSHLLTRRSSSIFRREQLGWTWNEEIELSLPTEDRKDHCEIELCCFDAQFKPRGRVKIPLGRFPPYEPVQQWYSLQETDPKATVLLKITCLPERQDNETLSQGSQENLEINDNNFHEDNKKQLFPLGIADYFVIAGCPQTARQDRLKLLAKPRRKPQSFANTTVPNNDLQQHTIVSPESVTLSPIILDRYPVEDRHDVEFPTEAQTFLLPDGCEIVKSPPKHCKKPRFFTFVFVSNGIRTYGFCMESYEPLEKLNKITDYEDLYAPIVLCYLTRIPIQASDFQWILKQTYEARKRNWLERVVQTVVDSIPVPLPGLVQVSFNLLSNERRLILLPNSKDLPPLIFPNLSTHLFNWFPLDAIINLWLAVLTEQKILFHSQNRQVLAILSETIIQLMYPFKWENAYVPVLPTSLLQLFEAPIPCIYGLRSDALRFIPENCSLTDHWIIVDADKCTIRFPDHEPVAKLPIELRNRLFRMIRNVLIDHKLNELRKDRLIRLSFLECLSSLLQGYRECFFALSTGTDSSTVFNKVQFFQRQANQKLQQIQFSNSNDLPSSSNQDDGRGFFVQLKQLTKD